MSSLKDRKSSRIEEPAAFEDLREPAPGLLPEVVIGRIIAIGADGAPMVAYPGSATGAPVAAAACGACDAAAVGRAAALLFVEGDPARPLVIGLVAASGAGAQQPDAAPPRPTVVVDPEGERVTVTAERELVLSCGKASITLTRAGKVLIRGAYLLSRSSGVNRIKGGSVQIN